MGLARRSETVFSKRGLCAGYRVLIFDIGGNKYRLIANVDFDEQIMVIKSVMTHEGYSRENF